MAYRRGRKRRYKGRRFSKKLSRRFYKALKRIGFRMQIDFLNLKKDIVYLAEINLRAKHIKPTTLAVRNTASKSNNEIFLMIKHYLKLAYWSNDLVLKHSYLDIAYDLGQVLRFRNALF